MLLDVLREEPASTGLFLDYDGCLAPIVGNPDAAVPAPGAVEVVEALRRRYARVGIISGRPVRFLMRQLPPDLTMVGLYGLERSVDGRVVDHPEAEPWRGVVDAVESTPGPPGMRREPKGLSITVHYREHPELADAVAEWAQEQAHRSGLVIRPAKMSFELHPPIRVDKGSVLRELSTGLSAVLFAGDDIGDRPAFDAIRDLRAAGVGACSVAVGLDAPAVLVAMADAHLADPAAMVELLRGLL